MSTYTHAGGVIDDSMAFAIEEAHDEARPFTWLACQYPGLAFGLPEMAIGYVAFADGSFVVGRTYYPACN